MGSLWPHHLIHHDRGDSKARSVTNGKSRFLLVTRSTLIREGLIGMSHHLKGVKLECVSDMVELMAHCERKGVPDVLIVDPSMGKEIRDCMQERDWNCRVLILWSRPHPGLSNLLQSPSICGLLPICLSGCDLYILLRRVAHCHHNSPETCGKWKECKVKLSVQLPNMPLTSREMDVFRCLGRGESVKEIAQELSVSVKTVESHRENIKQKLGLQGSAALLEAAILWRRGEYIPPEKYDQVHSNDQLSGRYCLEDGDTLQKG